MKNQKASEKKRKTFQFIRRDEDTNEGNEITSIDKGKRIASGNGSTQTTINHLLKKNFRKEMSTNYKNFLHYCDSV